MRSFVVILTRWSAAPDDNALACRPDGRGRSRGAAPHSGDRARESTHSSSARRPMRGDAKSSRYSRVGSACHPYFNETNEPPPPPRAGPISEKESSARAGAYQSGIGMQTYKLRGPFRTSYRLNPGVGRTLRATGRKLGDEGSWSRSSKMIRYQARNYIL